MTDVVSISSSAPPAVHAGRMPPSAMALAVLLHVLVALALWAIAMNPPRLTQAETPIDVTFEKPKPPPPPPAPPKPAPQKAQPTPPPKLGLAPPAEITADKPSQAPSRAKEAQQATAPQPPSLEQAVPPPQSQTQAPPAIEPSESERPAPSQQAHVSSVTPAPTPPARQTQPPQFRPSPLTQSPRQQPPALASREAPSPSPFVNPADTYNRARVADNYLWQVVGKLAGYRYQANVKATEGTTVIRIDIARNGRLLDVAVVRSSGVPAFDQGVLAGVRAGSPYAPLPPEIHGEHASFTLPLVSVREH